MEAITGQDDMTPEQRRTHRKHIKQALKARLRGRVIHRVLSVSERGEVYAKTGQVVGPGECKLRSCSRRGCAGWHGHFNYLLARREAA